MQVLLLHPYIHDHAVGQQLRQPCLYPRHKAVLAHVLARLASRQVRATMSSGSYMAAYFFTMGVSSDLMARSKNAVFVQKGHTAMTPMPRLFSSRFSARLKLSTKAFVAP